MKMFFLFILLGAFPVLAEPVAPEETTQAAGEMLVDWIHFEPGTAVVWEDKPENMQSYLGKLGVDWPPGSTMHVDQVKGLLYVQNTPRNIDLIQRIFGTRGGHEIQQVELEFQFVAFDAAAVGELAATNGITVESLTRLWTGGKGILLAAPRVFTRSGSEASVRGVRELVYPTSFGLAVLPSTNNQDGVGPVLPELFETREVGAILTMIPEIAAEGDRVLLNVDAEWVDLDDWIHYGMVGSGATNQLPMRQPVFTRVACQTLISLRHGSRVLLGGGVPAKEAGRLVYTFVTCRKMDGSGRPISDLPSRAGGTAAMSPK